MVSTAPPPTIVQNSGQSAAEKFSIVIASSCSYLL